jgi:hypothetical protein
MIRDFLLSLGEVRVSEMHESTRWRGGSPSGVSSELEDLSCEVLEDGGEVDWRGEARQQGIEVGWGAQLTRCSGSDTLSVVSLAEETVDTTDGELESGLGRTRLGLARRGVSLAARLSS